MRVRIGNQQKKRCWLNVWLMLVLSRTRWVNISYTFSQRFVVMQFWVPLSIHFMKMASTKYFTSTAVQGTKTYVYNQLHVQCFSCHTDITEISLHVAKISTEITSVRQQNSFDHQFRSAAYILSKPHDMLIRVSVKEGDTSKITNIFL